MMTIMISTQHENTEPLSRCQVCSTSIPAAADLCRSCGKRYEEQTKYSNTEARRRTELRP